MVEIETRQEDKQSNIEKEKTPISNLETMIIEEGATDPVLSTEGFILGEMTPLPVTMQDYAYRICSPLASVPLNELITVISDPYKPPPKGKDDRHQGVDFAFYRRYGRESIKGEIVQSVYRGRIAGCVVDKFPYGNALIVETPYGMLSSEIINALGIKSNQSIYILYGHLDSLAVKTMGEIINSCQSVGVVGKSGNAGVEHLHLEMRIGLSGEILAPMSYYVREATPEERESYLRWRTSGEFLHFDPMKFLDIAP